MFETRQVFPQEDKSRRARPVASVSVRIDIGVIWTLIDANIADDIEIEAVRARWALDALIARFLSIQDITVNASCAGITVLAGLTRRLASIAGIGLEVFISPGRACCHTCV